MIKNKNIKTTNESIINWELYHKMKSRQLNRQILRLNFGPLKIKFVFRHRYEKYRDLSDSHSMWGKWELGFWFKRNLCVGSKYKGKDMFSKKNQAYDYMLGVNLLWFKLWVDVSWNVLDIKL
jgi:hypothetical protein